MPLFLADRFHIDISGTDNGQQVHHSNRNKHFFFDFNLFLYCRAPVNTGKVYAGYSRLWSSWVGHSVVWLMGISVLEEQPPYQTI